MRWMDGFVEHRGRALRVESELGTSWQAQLVVGALPEQLAVSGGSRRADVRAGREPAVRDRSLAERPFSAQTSWRCASHGEESRMPTRSCARSQTASRASPTSRTSARRRLAIYWRHLQASSRPPLLRATLAIAIGAEDEQELEERVEMCRRSYGDIRLHRPLGDQLQLFLQHLPAQRTRVAGYDDTLTTEQVAAMMPTAAHVAGSPDGVLPRIHAVGLQATRQVQPEGGVRRRPQHHDPKRGRAGIGQDDARSEAQVRGIPPRGAGDRLRPQGGSPLSPS